VRFESLTLDVRYALRGIRRSSLFAASVAATIGLGLGVLCSAFTIVNAYVLAPVDLPDAATIVAALLPSLRASRIDPSKALRAE
jgi:hypothetical protein